MFDADNSGEVDFTEFITGMATFSSQADTESKLKFAFKIYDIDNDGFISNGELFQVSLSPAPAAFRNFNKCFWQILRTMVGNYLKESQLQQIVDKTMRSVDADEDGKINFDELCALIFKNKMDQKVEAITASIAQTI